MSVSSPANCGVTQGEFFPMALATEALTGPPEIAGDQRPDDAYSLCFDTPPLTTSLSLVGRSVLNLIINSSKHLWKFDGRRNPLGYVRRKIVTVC